MKIFLAVGVWLMAAIVSVLAQGNRADPPQLRVTERGLHHRVWETVIWQEDMFGETRPQTHRFTELATGMHTLRNGEFVPASDELEITATGARGSKALHGVEILGNLRSLGAVSITTPQGQVLRTRLIGIAYEDASGKSALIAEVKDCNGELLPSHNQVLFPDAFDDIKADVL